MPSKGGDSWRGCPRTTWRVLLLRRVCVHALVRYNPNVYRTTSRATPLAIPLCASGGVAPRLRRAIRICPVDSELIHLGARYR
jgi:hypothetical protein